jgi:GTP cyclohydrolase I
MPSWDAAIMKATVVELSWSNVHVLANIVADRIDQRFPDCLIKLYPIPRGGVYVALAIKAAAAAPTKFIIVSDPSQADAYVDDIVDSGNTRLRTFRTYGEKPFYALVDKTVPGHENHKRPGEGPTWWVFPWEKMSAESGPEDNVRRIIEYIGDDPEREGLKDTPARVVRSYAELFAGYKMDPAEVLKTVFTDGACDEMVVLTNISFFSTCEHHLLPYFGTASVGYVPRGRVVGISKLARLLDVFSRRLQLQERITIQVTAALDNFLEPLGSACVLKASHMCMACRGVRQPDTELITSSMTGVFRDRPEARAEFFQLVGGKR